MCVCVCPLDIYADTNVRLINGWSIVSRILIDRRGVHTQSAGYVCVECGHTSNTAWGYLKLKCYGGQTENFEI
jgi:hypothetical protein